MEGRPAMLLKKNTSLDARIAMFDRPLATPEPFSPRLAAAPGSPRAMCVADSAWIEGSPRRGGFGVREQARPQLFRLDTCTNTSENSDLGDDASGSEDCARANVAVTDSAWTGDSLCSPREEKPPQLFRIDTCNNLSDDPDLEDGEPLRTNREASAAELQEEPKKTSAYLGIDEAAGTCTPSSELDVSDLDSETLQEDDLEPSQAVFPVPCHRARLLAWGCATATMALLAAHGTRPLFLAHSPRNGVGVSVGRVKAALF